MTIRIGLERLLNDQIHVVRGKRVGLVASASSLDANLVSSIERLHECDQIRLVTLFGPEHGIHGNEQAGDQVSSYIDKATGLPVYSLYGDTRKPTSEMLQNLDALIYDVQDGGLRFYTYLSTLAYILQAGAECSVPVIVLDRPNPITGTMLEGGNLDTAFSSFIGVYPIPIRHGMTAGEIALYINDRFNIGCDLTVVQITGWHRNMWFDETGLPFVPLSPNLPTLSALTVYPGTCLVEGTNLSEGRGTTKPFEYIGAPWLDAESLVLTMNNLNLAGVRFRPVYFTPMFSKHEKQFCAGVHVYVTNRHIFRPVETTLHLLTHIMEQHPDQFEFHAPWKEGEQLPFDLLSGSSEARSHLTTRKPIPDLLSQWEQDIEVFSSQRAPYLLYEE